MTTLKSRELILAGIGDEADWRRRYRQLVHMSVRHTVYCRERLKLPPLTHQQIKALLRSHSQYYFGVTSLREWFKEMRANRDYFEQCESFPFAGHQDLILTGD